jgi:hypothetical protein
MQGAARQGRVELHLQHSGEASWRDAHSDNWTRGIWLAQAWISPWYAVVRVRSEESATALLIRRAGQHPGQYRALCAWLRWSGENDKTRLGPTG